MDIDISFCFGILHLNYPEDCLNHRHLTPFQLQNTNAYTMPNSIFIWNTFRPVNLSVIFKSIAFVSSTRDKAQGNWIPSTVLLIVLYLLSDNRQRNFKSRSHLSAINLRLSFTALPSPLC